MLTTYLPHLVIWLILTLIVISLAIYRRKISSQVDETLHVLDAEAQAIPTQEIVAKKLVVVDRWGKILTVISVLYLLGMAAAYFYSSFQDQSIKLG
jgi:hypothetical protein